MGNLPLKIRWTVFAVLALLALAVRLPQLGNRPMHTDEAINGYITGELLVGKNFEYDPQDRHGPALQLLATPIARLCGAKNFSELTETQLRLTPAIAGSATVLLFGAGVEMFGFASCFIAALLFAFAPLPLYYSRDFIHETFFVTATLGLILSGRRLLASGTSTRLHSLCLAAVTGLCAALMLAAKETAVIHFFALGAALVCGWLWNVRHNAERESFITLGAVAVGLGVFVVTTILLFTWFGHNWRALTDLLRAMVRFGHRAGGEGHEKPFCYYIHLLSGGWSGAALLALAIGGAICAVIDFTRRKIFTPMIFISLYGVLIALIYSAIPYKTPWLALNLWLPMSLLVGAAIVGLWQKFTRTSARSLMILAALLLVVAIGHDSRNRVFRFAADEKNPYAYAQTVDGLLDLPPKLEDLSKTMHLASPRIAVVAADSWPLPWYLRKFSQVGYWQPGQETGPADFFITTPEAVDKLGDKLKNFRPQFFGLRPEVLIILWSSQP